MKYVSCSNLKQRVNKPHLFVSILLYTGQLFNFNRNIVCFTKYLNRFSERLLMYFSNVNKINLESSEIIYHIFNTNSQYFKHTFYYVCVSIVLSLKTKDMASGFKIIFLSATCVCRLIVYLIKIIVWNNVKSSYSIS